MKTISQSIAMSIKLACAPLLLLAFVACGKSNDNNGSNVAAIQYGIQAGGQCYDITHNTPATSPTYCNGVQGQFANNSQFRFVGNQCISSINNQPVDPTNCQNTGVYGGGYNNTYGNNQVNGYPQIYPMGQEYAAYFGANSYPSTYGGGGAYSGTQSCIGQYYSYNGFTARLQACDGYSCHGLFLYSAQTRQRVLCL